MLWIWLRKGGIDPYTLKGSLGSDVSVILKVTFDLSKHIIHSHTMKYKRRFNCANIESRLGDINCHMVGYLRNLQQPNLRHGTCSMSGRLAD